MEMKKVFQSLIVFAVVFLVVFLVDSAMNNNKTNSKASSKDKNAENVKEEYKVKNNLYFKDKDVELVLYKDNTYILYQKNDIQGGTYKIVDNKLELNQTKKYGEKCYDLVKASYTYIVELKNNEVINITIASNKLSTSSLDELSNVKDVLLNKNAACEIKAEKKETKEKTN